MLHKEGLVEFYKINFQLMQHYKYSLNDLEVMLPWERDIYISLLLQHIQEENDRRAKEAGVM